MTSLFTDCSPDVEAEIHFLEIAMEKRRYSQYVRVEKEKSNQAYEVSRFGLVELSAFW